MRRLQKPRPCTNSGSLLQEHSLTPSVLRTPSSTLALVLCVTDSTKQGRLCCTLCEGVRAGLLPPICPLPTVVLSILRGAVCVPTTDAYSSDPLRQTTKWQFGSKRCHLFYKISTGYSRKKKPSTRCIINTRFKTVWFQTLRKNGSTGPACEWQEKAISNRKTLLMQHSSHARQWNHTQIVACSHFLLHSNKQKEIKQL